MAETRLKLRRKDEVAVRMYGQGFGDCFLLAFPRQTAGKRVSRANPVYVVIDSGVFFQTPGDRARMKAVANSILAATGGKVDLLVATHEHHDHLCGFEYARAEWKKIRVGRVWLAWTEDARHPATVKYDHEKEVLERQARLALEAAMRAAAAAPDTQARPATQLARQLERVRALVEFGAGAVEAVAVPASGRLKPGKIKAPRDVSKTPDLVLDDLATNPGERFKQGSKTERDFCEPGQVLTVPQTRVDAYVLGPPTDEAHLTQEMDVNEVYPEERREAPTPEDRAAALADFSRRVKQAAAVDRAERASMGAALERRSLEAAGEAAPADSGAPFPPSLGISYDAARQHAFFRANYFEGRPDRQIETDWLFGFGQLALQVDRVINNTSLVLAFRLPDERVLLFVGDAQVGNWLSWHEIKPEDWRRLKGETLTYRPTAEQLLARTVVYKVGHHGSHNATLEKRGLEMMQDGVTAFVPTSRVFPQERQGWIIPLPSVTDALWAKSGGRVVFPHTHAGYDYTNTQFAEEVESAQDKFAAMVLNGKEIEAAVPLWRQVRF